MKYTLLIISVIAFSSCSLLMPSKKKPKPTKIKLIKGADNVRLAEDLSSLVGCSLVVELKGEVDNPSKKDLQNLIRNMGHKKRVDIVSNFRYKKDPELPEDSKLVKVIADGYRC